MRINISLFKSLIHFVRSSKISSILRYSYSHVEVDGAETDNLNYFSQPKQNDVMHQKTS